jgi:hypothetical protein
VRHSSISPQFIQRHAEFTILLKPRLLPGPLDDNQRPQYQEPTAFEVNDVGASFTGLRLSVGLSWYAVDRCPVPYHFPEDIHSDAELHIGLGDGPDVLEGKGPTGANPLLPYLEIRPPDPPPDIGEKVMVEQLAAEIRPGD